MAAAAASRNSCHRSSALSWDLFSSCATPDSPGSRTVKWHHYTCFGRIRYRGSFCVGGRINWSAAQDAWQAAARVRHAPPSITPHSASGVQEGAKKPGRGADSAGSKNDRAGVGDEPASSRQCHQILNAAAQNFLCARRGIHVAALNLRRSSLQ
jgi:hypothetical protein